MTGLPIAGGTALRPGPNLRQLIEHHLSQRRPIELAAAVDIIVPLCVSVADVHEQGFGLYVYPSNIVQTPRGYSVANELAARPPSHPADLACLPPEANPGELGGARASVYSIGAILYELLTGQSVGPQMRRPTELIPGLPQAVEVLLAKALIRDPAQRPDDLYALAQALYGLSPKPTIAPPPAADAGHLDQIDGVEIDVSLSMLPSAMPPRVAAVALAPEQRGRPPGAPAPHLGAVASHGIGPAAIPPAAAYPAAAIPPAVVRSPSPSQGSAVDEATAQLAALKAKLESDPTPRYVVIRDGMDHGPFNSVELLQQIRTHNFSGDDLLQNTETREERPIKGWPDFAPFAEHAQRHKAIADEKAAVHLGVAQDSKRTRGKMVGGLAVVVLLLLGAGGWFVTQVGTRSDEVAVQTEAVSNIEAEGALKADKKSAAGRKGSRVVGSSGGIPLLGGGMSCEAAQATYVEEIKMTGGQADISRGQYSSIMNSGSYFSHCGVPSNVAVNICVAVQAGKAVGVTVSTSPNHSSRACISKAVRGMRFPSHPKLDVVRVAFAAQ